VPRRLCAFTFAFCTCTVNSAQGISGVTERTAEASRHCLSVVIANRAQGRFAGFLCVSHRCGDAPTPIRKDRLGIGLVGSITPEVEIE
jgi:hypothetical protein